MEVAQALRESLKAAAKAAAVKRKREEEQAKALQDQGEGQVKGRITSFGGEGRMDLKGGRRGLIAVRGTWC
jgi:hypothetical protein